MTEWQPIETAPKDGTDILVWGGLRLGYLVVSFNYFGDPDFPWLTLDGPSYIKDGFTHWMPLPEAPR